MTATAVTCAICQRPLGTATDLGRVGYYHTEPAGHQPVPARPPAGTVCDFCAGPAPTWALPVRPLGIRIYTGREPVAANADNAGAWLACDTCAWHIRGEHWHAMAHRAAHLAAQRYGRPPNPRAEATVAASLLNLWTVVRANTLGPLHRQDTP